VSTSTTQSGRGGLAIVILVLALGALAYLGWGFLHQSSSLPPVTTSAASEASARDKALAFAQAEAKARLSGRPVSVIETFDDAELSALANEAAQAKALPLDQIVLHSTSQGTIKGQAQAHVVGQTVPVYLEGVPTVSDGNRLVLQVTSTQVGSVPLPGPVTDQVTRSIRQPLELGQPLTGFQDVRVTTADGQLTVRGVAQPG
jgi:hypothetical protein